MLGLAGAVGWSAQRSRGPEFASGYLQRLSARGGPRPRRLTVADTWDPEKHNAPLQKRRLGVISTAALLPRNSGTHCEWLIQP